MRHTRRVQFHKAWIGLLAAAIFATVMTPSQASAASACSNCYTKYADCVGHCHGDCAYPDWQIDCGDCCTMQQAKCNAKLGYDYSTCYLPKRPCN